MLPVISHTRLPVGQSLKSPDLVAYCDPHDLIAVATEDVVVYRISGKVAFTIKRKDADLQATALSWKQDGSLLAVGWSDGTFALYSGESGRLVSTDRVLAESENDIVVTCFSWMRHRSDSHLPRTQAAELTTEEWADQLLPDPEDEGADAFNGAMPTDGRGAIEQLTRSIALFDVTAVLPRLSSLPNHGHRNLQANDMFPSQGALDTMFAPSKNDDLGRSVDILLAFTSDGTIKVIQDNTVKIGISNFGGPPIFSAAHASCSQHTALVQTETGSGLEVRSLDLPLQTLSSPLLQVIGINRKRLSHLLAYIQHTLLCLMQDFATGLQFPARLMANIETELEEKQEGSLAFNLYHLAMTTDFTPTMLEWLVDIVKETNHKRWQNAITTMYTNLAHHLFMHLKPALERLTIATSALKGVAQFYEGGSKFDAEPELFTRILASVDSLSILVEKTLLVTGEEQKRFLAFIKWLRVMIDIGVAGPGTKGAMETEEKENPNIEYALVLKYIEYTMTGSRLAGYIEPLPPADGLVAKIPKDGTPNAVYERTLEVLQVLDKAKAKDKLEVKGVQDPEMYVSMPLLGALLADNVEVALKRITDWQGKMLKPPSKLNLNDATAALLARSTIFDMHVVTEAGPQDTQQNVKTEILWLQDDSELSILSLPHVSPSTKAEPQAPQHDLTLTLAHDADGVRILDAKFHPHERQIVFALSQNVNGRHIMECNATIDTNKWTILHAFDEAFSPQKLLIGGRKNRMVCVVFGHGGKEWQILDLVARRSSPSAAADSDLS